MTTKGSRPTMDRPAPVLAASDATNSHRAALDLTPNLRARGGLNSRPVKPRSAPKLLAPGGPDSPATVEGSATNHAASRGPKTAGRQASLDAQSRFAAGADAGPAAIPSLLDPALSLAADILDDIERVRIANENRIRQLTRDEPDADGEERGFGLSPDHPDVLGLGILVQQLQALEHEATLNLRRKLRKHPLHPWVKAQRGVGEKQAARLLAAIGDPYINSAKGEPRTVSALWAYCGLHVLSADQGRLDTQRSTVGGDQHGDLHTAADAHSSTGVAAKRRRGERANWSSRAKMRAHLVAESCVKQLGPDCRDGHFVTDAQVPGAVAATNGRGGQPVAEDHHSRAVPACTCSPYRVVYDQRRAHTAVTHPDWTDGHSHNDALRVASKAILRDLWRAARDWHHAQTPARSQL